ncbi:hypothetical protein [Parabacteroides chongii]|uniref:hypothetical protein n=1 Tax=Parabacteroides chongii TaxID=2685834 RepID=UPI00240E3C76|nr:hypothetical protein [Parabacteroides chongii]WFE84428.1 hypothetical protein P3L47_20200 [Parabacteroides chongii]
MIVVEYFGAETNFFPRKGGGNKRRLRSVYAVCFARRRRGASPVWNCKNSPNGEDNPQEVGYRSDYTGAFITDWEIPMEPQGTREDPGVDFVVDWTN